MTQPAVIHYRWDLDKTYLRTEFDSLRDLVRTFRATAEEREVVPGAPALLRELLRPRGADGEPVRRVTFVSGSPRQMREVLTRRLALDGIEPDAFLLKPNLSNLLTLRLGALRDQLGYKLDALLSSRAAAENVTEVLFGDDAEQDALVYSLYADIAGGRLGRTEVDRLLEVGRVYDRERRSIGEAMAQARPPVQVRRILIHLDRRSPVGRFDVYGERVVPIYNYFQAALVLHGDGLLPASSLTGVADAMVDEGYSVQRLVNSAQDLARRGRLDARTAELAVGAVSEAGTLLMRPSVWWAADLVAGLRSLQLDGAAPLPEPSPALYETLVRARSRYRSVPQVARGIGWLE